MLEKQLRMFSLWLIEIQVVEESNIHQVGRTANTEFVRC